MLYKFVISLFVCNWIFTIETYFIRTMIQIILTCLTNWYSIKLGPRASPTYNVLNSILDSFDGNIQKSNILYNMKIWFWKHFLIFIYHIYKICKCCKNKLVFFPIIFHYHSFQWITEDSHISHELKIYWKYIDIELKVPKNPHYENMSTLKGWFVGAPKVQSPWW